MQNADFSPLGKVKLTQGDSGSNRPSCVLKSFAKHTDAAMLIVNSLPRLKNCDRPAILQPRKARVSYQKLGALTGLIGMNLASHHIPYPAHRLHQPTFSIRF